jgi:hypothetical protein
LLNHALLNEFVEWKRLGWDRELCLPTDSEMPLWNYAIMTKGKFSGYVLVSKSFRKKISES